MYTACCGCGCAADDPVMMQLIREARREAEELRARLAAAEAGKAQLAAENRQLRAQLGLPPAGGQTGLAAQAGGFGQDIGRPETSVEAVEAAGGGNEGQPRHVQDEGEEKVIRTGIVASGSSRATAEAPGSIDGVNSEEGGQPAAGGGGGNSGSALLASGGVGGGEVLLQDASHRQEVSEALTASKPRRRR